MVDSAWYYVVVLIAALIVIGLAIKFKNKFIKYIPALIFSVAAIYNLIGAYIVEGLDSFDYVIGFIVIGISAIFLLVETIIIDLIIYVVNKQKEIRKEN